MNKKWSVLKHFCKEPDMVVTSVVSVLWKQRQWDHEFLVSFCPMPKTRIRSNLSPQPNYSCCLVYMGHVMWSGASSALTQIPRSFSKCLIQTLGNSGDQVFFIFPVAPSLSIIWLKFCIYEVSSFIFISLRTSEVVSSYVCTDYWISSANFIFTVLFAHFLLSDWW